MDPATTYGAFIAAGATLSTAIAALFKAWDKSNDKRFAQLEEERDKARAAEAAATAALLDVQEKRFEQWTAALREMLDHVSASRQAMESIREAIAELTRRQ